MGRGVYRPACSLGGMTACPQARWTDSIIIYDPARDSRGNVQLERLSPMDAMAALQVR